MGKFTNNIYERQVNDKKSAYYFYLCRKYAVCCFSFVLFSISIDVIISCLIRYFLLIKIQYLFFI